MTYKELLNSLSQLTPEQLEQSVTVSLDLSEEVCQVNEVIEIDENDILGNILDAGHILHGRETAQGNLTHAFLPTLGFLHHLLNQGGLHRAWAENIGPDVVFGITYANGPG